MTLTREFLAYVLYSVIVVVCGVVIFDPTAYWAYLIGFMTAAVMFGPLRYWLIRHEAERLEGADA